MFQAAKALLVILVIASIVFAAARPACLRFTTAEDFDRRRNVWLALTVAAFLSPSFWLYAAFAALLLAWAARRDTAPASIYLLAYAVIPPIYMYVPVVGINQLFTLTEARLLSLVVLLPLAVSLYVRNEGGAARAWTVFDTALVGYLALQVVLALPFESPTNTMRRGFLLGIDLLLPFYVFGRAVARREDLTDLMAVFVVCAAIYAAIGLFESLKGWLLYEQVGPRWGASNGGAFLMRGNSLRAQASAGHSLTFGYVLTVAFGFWLHLRNHVEARWLRWGTTLLLCLGIYASHSRGPWLCAVIVYFVYLMLSPRGASGLLKGAMSALLIGGVVALTPLGARIIEVLPFIGSADQDNVLYRQRLATESWRLIMQNPALGDPFVLAHMDDLRQGQGIIDLMNAYAAVALFSGLIGLALFGTAVAGPAARAFLWLRRLRRSDPDLSSIGAALVASMVGSLFFMATASVDWVEYVLAGLLCAYVAIGRPFAVNAQPPPEVWPAGSPDFSST